MTDTNGPPAAGGDPVDTRAAEPGGSGCGVTGCLTLALVMSILLLGLMIALALFRPWVSPPVLR